MLRLLYAVLLTAPVMLLLDGLWLGVIAKDSIKAGLGYHLAPSFLLTPAILFYACYLVGIMIFAAHPAIVAHSPMRALLYGALFGFMCYMTYDLTNLATLKDWPLKVALVDMAWGTTLTAIASYTMYLVYGLLG